MAQTPKTYNQPKVLKSQSQALEFATFYIGEALCGIDILLVQEINRQIEVTCIPKAPDYVIGVLNLRGKIVTVIDLGKKLGLSPIRVSKYNRNIIVNSQDEHIGLVVDRISDVIITDSSKIEPAPSNIGGLRGKYFKGVYKTDRSLIGILNIENVLKEDSSNPVNIAT
ncbi:MAG: chemotaxis protein CheW [Desulfobacterales bacterium]|nr:chemotaxis protein CheW [Desulfobacterales bacterium]MBF0395888.1 chemotaxis protein CheW [Desulfobacterales bacterium]